MKVSQMALKILCSFLGGRRRVKEVPYLTTDLVNNVSNFFSRYQGGLNAS